jgi:hypothetical protein
LLLRIPIEKLLARDHRSKKTQADHLTYLFFIWKTNAS